MNYKTTLAVLVVFALAFAATPATGADTGKFGDKLDANSFEVDKTAKGAHCDAIDHTVAPSCSIAYFDVDGDGTPDMDEPLYLVAGDIAHAATGTFGINALRLTAYGGHAAGSQVALADIEFGKTAKPISSAGPHYAHFGYVDETGDGKFDSGDTLYLDMPDSNGATAAGTGLYTGNLEGVVGVGDINMKTGARITGTTGDHGSPITAFAAPQVLYVDVNDKSDYDAGDILILDVDGAGKLTVNDMVFSGSQFLTLVTGTYQYVDVSASLINNAPYTLTVCDDTAANGGTATTDGGIAKIGEFLFNMYFYDADADGSFDAGETIYLGGQTACIDSVNGATGTPDATTSDLFGDAVTIKQDVIGKDWVRMSAFGSLAAGTQVAGVDVDNGKAAVALATIANLKYVDETGNGFTADDRQVLDIGTGNTGALGVGDIMFPSGVKVTASSADLGTPLQTFSGAAIKAFDEDGDGKYDTGDSVWFLEAGTKLQEGDVQLTPNFGSKLAQGDSRASYAAEAFASTMSLGWADFDNDHVVDLDEPVYLTAATKAAWTQTACPPTTTPGTIAHGTAQGQRYDVRLTSENGAPGSKVLTTDSDYKEVLTFDLVCATAGSTVDGLAIMFVDDLGDGYTSDDPVYIDTNNDQKVTVGDIILATGARVTTANADIGVTLTGFATPGFKFMNLDQTAGYSAGDNVYFMDDTGVALKVNDVRISTAKIVTGSNPTPTATATTTPTATATTTPTATATTTPTATATSTPTDTMTPTPTTTEETPRTPGFELVALVAALGAALVLVRRRN